MMVKNGGPAFPVMWDYADNETGMSLRDWFAGQALRIAWQTWADGYFVDCGDPAKEIAECAYQYADAMLAEREKAK